MACQFQFTNNLGIVDDLEDEHFDEVLKKMAAKVNGTGTGNNMFDSDNESENYHNESESDYDHESEYNSEHENENSEGASEDILFKKKHASFKGDRQSHRVRPQKKLKCEYFLHSVQQ